MEDPREDIKKVIRELINRPSFADQAHAIRTYCTHDVYFYYYYLNVGGGRKDVISIYQLGNLLYNYQAVKFHDIVYDESTNSMAVYMTVYVRPWSAFYRERFFVFFTFFQLENFVHKNFVHKDGKVVKLIKVQSDFFDRTPTAALVPFLSLFYNSVWLRVLFGYVIVLIVRSLRYVVRVFYPFYPHRMRWEDTRAHPLDVSKTLL
ncbi:hypothetical protein KP509_15G032000 [Ceratopteris richardii]|uniref:SigF-like NTF2-like domain-containing protein n=1 Tax=Ceratopteris richardii TaxID=49495 RepID=A0A8T2T282_CERRI|nr:hypothetical protein KP509_15G032000 [Ceratopteris richardii]